jgi:hypothetical protein
VGSIRAARTSSGSNGASGGASNLAGPSSVAAWASSGCSGAFYRLRS